MCVCVCVSRMSLSSADFTWKKNHKIKHILTEFWLTFDDWLRRSNHIENWLKILVKNCTPPAVSIFGAKPIHTHIRTLACTCIPFVSFTQDSTQSIWMCFGKASWSQCFFNRNCRKKYYFHTKNIYWIKKLKILY